jgi:hypothetical protein
MVQAFCGVVNLENNTYNAPHASQHGDAEFVGQENIDDDDGSDRGENHAVDADEIEQLHGEGREQPGDGADRPAMRVAVLREMLGMMPLEREPGAVDGRVGGGPAGDDHADQAGPADGFETIGPGATLAGSVPCFWSW